MQILGSPIALDTPEYADMKQRFWYWQGQSGQKYIHSVYEIDACPPLPGAVYVAVKRVGLMRVAVAVGRFAPFWDKTLGEDDLRRLEMLGVDEVHVHLLARNPEMVDSVKQDLASALGEVRTSYGFSESEPQPSYSH